MRQSTFRCGQQAHAMARMKHSNSTLHTRTRTRTHTRNAQSKLVSMTELEHGKQHVGHCNLVFWRSGVLEAHSPVLFFEIMTHGLILVACLSSRCALLCLACSVLRALSCMLVLYIASSACLCLACALSCVLVIIFNPGSFLCVLLLLCKDFVYSCSRVVVSSK